MVNRCAVVAPESGPMEQGTKSAKAKVEARPTVIRKSRKIDGSTGPQLKQRLAEALEQQTATSAILRVISQSPTDVQTVFDAIVKSAVRLCEARFGAVFRLDRGLVHLAACHNFTGPLLSRMQSWYPMMPNRGHVSGRTILTGTAVQVPDILADEDYLGTTLKEAGFRSLLGLPLLRGGSPIGAIVIYRAEPGQFENKHFELLKTFADQAVIAIENARLFREIEDKSRQLEIASQHKSEFLANMSHELRTPLNAIIGFSEVLSERMFGDINEKQAEYISDILQSGQHLLSLINDILDLSKIEAGRMELELSDFDLPSSIENTLTLVRERAVRRGIKLGHTVDEHLGMVRADERRVKQVLLNLLSNALKFTPKGGRIDVRAAVRDGMAEISVADTGVGISPEDQELVFEEFRQVGTAANQVEGTGLGLAISRKFIEVHGGRIWVESQVGKGSTFAFTLPLSIDHHDRAG